MSAEFKILIVATFLHVPFGIILYNIGSLAILHPAAVFFVGLYWAAKKDVKLQRVALVVAYLIGSEVLWRMAQVPVFWEFGKYGSAAISILALIRRGHIEIPRLPLVYFALLLPACILSLIELDLSEARGSISFNLSGPFCLMISCWFFSCVRVYPHGMKRVLFAVLVPLISVAFVTLFYTVTIEEISFNTESNFATSGGFGPNQVSSMLGLATFLVVFCLIVFRSSAGLKIFFLMAAILFSAQSVMTFSRSGIYGAIGAITAVMFLDFRNPIRMAGRLAPVALAAGLFLLVIFPILNDFTGGNLLARFEETQTSNRTEIIGSDFEMFAENPVFGVGVGVSTGYREKFLGGSAASHTEFSRLFSEHGMLGILAIILLIFIMVRNLRRQTSSLGRALVLGCSVWSVLYMFNSGMRLAAPSFVLGLTCMTVVNGISGPPRSVKQKASAEV